jgi:hypothetical protein
MPNNLNAHSKYIGFAMEAAQTEENFTSELVNVAVQPVLVSANQASDLRHIHLTDHGAPELQVETIAHPDLGCHESLESPLKKVIRDRPIGQPKYGVASGARGEDMARRRRAKVDTALQHACTHYANLPRHILICNSRCSFSLLPALCCPHLPFPSTSTRLCPALTPDNR